MEYDEENNQLDVEFCPVEHPVEPEEEDHPVKCPVPISSSLLRVSLVLFELFWSYTKFLTFNDKDPFFNCEELKREIKTGLG